MDRESIRAGNFPFERHREDPVDDRGPSRRYDDSLLRVEIGKLPAGRAGFLFQSQQSVCFDLRELAEDAGGTRYSRRREYLGGVVLLECDDGLVGTCREDVRLVSARSCARRTDREALAVEEFLELAHIVARHALPQ